MKKTAFIMLICMILSCITASASGISESFTAEITDSSIKAVIFSVIKPNTIGVEDFDGLTAGNINNALYAYEIYERTDREDETVTFDVSIPDDAPKGTYKVRITFVNDDIEKTYSEYDSIEVMSDNDINTVQTADAGDIVTILDDFVNVKEFFDLPELEEIKLIPNYGEYFVSVRQSYFPNGYTNKADDIFLNVRIAILGQRILTKSDKTEEAITLYSKPEFGIDGYKELTSEMKHKVIDNYEITGTEYDVKTAFADFRKAMGLTVLSYGTVEEKAEALLSYGSEMEIPIYDEDERTRIARYMSGTFTSWAEAKQAVEKAKNEYIPPKKPVSSGISGGGGGGNNSTVATVTAPMTPTVPQNEEKTQTEGVFSDIADVLWAKDDILSLYEKKIINGYDGKFNPHSRISRAEFCKIVVAAFGMESVTVNTFFDDVSREMWHYPYISAAYTNGIVTGVTENEFKPDMPVMRQDMAVIISRLPVLKNIRVENAVQFEDEQDIAEYAKEAVQVLCGTKIITGYEDGTFRAASNATKAEAAVIVQRLLRYTEGMKK